jgi:hypothetical protein
MTFGVQLRQDRLSEQNHFQIATLDDGQRAQTWWQVVLSDAGSLVTAALHFPAVKARCWKA